LRITVQLTAVLILCLFTGWECVRASGSPLALLGEVNVRGESVFLSDLLARPIPPAIRDAAQNIRVGDAPSLGTTVILSGEKIAALLKNERSLRGITQGIDVPPQIVVSRLGRRITREEVVTIIQKALDRNPIPESSGLDWEGVHFSAPVVTATDAKLEVRRVDFDGAMQQAQFLLACDADKRIPPFLVTAQLRRNSANTADVPAPPSISVRVRTAEEPRTESLASGSGDAMVQPGKLANLHVVSGTMQMQLSVLPLEKGALGETVRVRVPGNGKVLRGRVTSAGWLEAQF
jgi:Chaperone for flagella basal body P-ring formation